jgi:hypothetical protein
VAEVRFTYGLQGRAPRSHTRRGILPRRGRRPDRLCGVAHIGGGIRESASGTRQFGERVGNFVQLAGSDLRDILDADHPYSLLSELKLFEFGRPIRSRWRR